jgi:hypothetical protein
MAEWRSFCETMAFYQERITPWLIHLSMQQRIPRHREEGNQPSEETMIALSDTGLASGRERFGRTG